MADKKETSAKKRGFLAGVKGFFARIGRFLKETRSELKKVVWPSKKQTKNNTIVVIVVIIIAALVLIALDFAFGGIIRLLIGA